MSAYHLISATLTVAGLVFLGIGVRGLFHNREQMLIALDQWLACCLLPDSYADETISAWAHRKQNKRLERSINWIFNNPNHCATAYVSETEGSQNAKEYN